MACIDASGQLSATARQVLAALVEPAIAEEVVQKTGLPLYRIRSGLREMQTAQLVSEQNGQWVSTAQGRALLEQNAKAV